MDQLFNGNHFLITNRDIALDTMQYIELELLNELDRICRKYNIKYSLGGGTCLGQVRHGGFIPWDDDIDVDMTVENYDKFLNVVFEELDETKFFLRCRQTDKSHLRSCMRLENKLTQLSTPLWDKKGETSGVFIDIFRISNLPSDKHKRKTISSKLFEIRCVQMYKEYHHFAKHLPKAKHNKIMLLAIFIPTFIINKWEDKLIHFCDNDNDKEQGWMLDDAIVNGDHGGYPNEGLNEYSDVKFENLLVMNKKNSDFYLRTLYGDKYLDWLPPAKRISHHQWTKVDFGPYEKLFNLGTKYKQEMSILYTYDKLVQMKKVSDMIVNKVEDICHKYGIHYSIPRINSNIFDDCFEGIRNVWFMPDRILMTRENFSLFENICQEELGPSFFYQSHKTDPQYMYYYSRIRLNYTYIRERRINARTEDNLNSGFFIEIIPMDNIPDNQQAIKKHMKKLRRWHRFLAIKMKSSMKYFFKTNFRNKIKLLFLLPYSLEDIYNKIDLIAREYETEDTLNCCDSTGTRAEGKVLGKTDLDNNRYLTGFKKGTYHAKSINFLIDNLWKRYGACHLNYYDIPNNQLSVLKFDEKNDVMLSVEDITSRHY